jgi:hypothetical protein
LKRRENTIKKKERERENHFFEPKNKERKVLLRLLSINTPSFLDIQGFFKKNTSTGIKKNC